MIIVTCDGTRCARQYKGMAGRIEKRGSRCIWPMSGRAFRTTPARHSAVREEQVGGQVFRGQGVERFPCDRIYRVVSTGDPRHQVAVKIGERSPGRGPVGHRRPDHHGKSGVTATVVLRAGSAFYGRDVITAAHRAGAKFSMLPAIGRPSRSAVKLCW